MNIEKSAIYLTSEEILELEDIALNEDEKAALAFLKKLKKKIEVQQRQKCGSPVVRGE